MNTTAAPGLFTRLAGLILLAVFGAGQLPVLPLLAAAVAALDGEHRVELTAGREAVRLVLHHDRGTALQSGHHHGGLMRIIAGDDKKGPHPDHQLLFTAAGSLAKEQEAPVPEVKRIAVSCPGARSGEVSVTVPGLDRNSAHLGALLPPWWPPPPAECAWGRVVLLI